MKACQIVAVQAMIYGTCLVLLIAAALLSR